MTKVLNTCLYCGYQWKDFPGGYAKKLVPTDGIGLKWELCCPNCKHVYFKAEKING